jgi:hypothetical protein
MALLLSMHWQMATASQASPPHCIDYTHKLRHAETLADWLANVVKIRTSNEEFYRLFRHSAEDMAGPPPMASTVYGFLPAAGFPGLSRRSDATA